MDSNRNLSNLSEKRDEDILSNYSKSRGEGWKSSKWRMPFSSGSNHYKIAYYSIFAGYKAGNKAKLYMLLIVSVLVILVVFAVIKSEKLFSFPFSDKPDSDYGAAIINISDEALLEVNIINKTPSVVSDCFEEKKGARYELSVAERDIIERVVMAEAGGEGYYGQKLIAKCILNSAEKLNILPSEVVVALQYTKARPDPSDQVKQAVSAVFDIGERVTDDLIMYFYNPDKCESIWHEEQVFVIEYGGHRFFSER